MFKNVSGQKFIVFAFNSSTLEPVTGDASNITANLKLDHGSASATNDANPTETEKGFYAFDATQAETNADVLQILPVSSTSSVEVISVPGIIKTQPQYWPDATLSSGGVQEVNTTQIEGSDATDQINAEVDASIETYHLDHLFAADYDPASKPGVSTALLNELIEDDGGVSRYTANALEQAPSGGGSGGLTALASGTAQSGTSTTLVLAASSAFADDELIGNVINIHTGTGAGQSRLITDNVNSSDTVTVTPAWTTTPSSDSEYEIVQGSVNVEQIERVDATTQIRDNGSNVLVSTTIATLASQTSFTLTAGSADDGAYVEAKAYFIFIDQTTAEQKGAAYATAYTGSTKTVSLKSAPGFTIATGDTVIVVSRPPQDATITTATAASTAASTSLQSGDYIEIVQGASKTFTVNVDSAIVDATGLTPKAAFRKVTSLSESSAPGVIDGTVNNGGTSSQSLTFEIPKATTADMALSVTGDESRTVSPNIQNAYNIIITVPEAPSAGDCTPAITLYAKVLAGNSACS